MDAKSAPTGSLENRQERGFPQRPQPASSSPSRSTKNGAQADQADECREFVSFRRPLTPRGPAPCELYLPWAEFRDKTGTVLGSDASRRARQLASDHHPAWEQCSQRAKQLHARNAAIMLGPEPGTSREDPVDVVVCWTRRGETIGGTGMAIRIARAKKIPVVNLYHHHQIKTVVNAIAEVTNDPRWRDAAPKKSPYDNIDVTRAPEAPAGGNPTGEEATRRAPAPTR